MRALDYFRQMVGPSLPGPLSNSFWTKFIPQMTHTENTVRHATIAISYLYEDILNCGVSRIGKPRYKSALPHYNLAIQQAIALSQQGNLDLILICVTLFSEIELIQGNPMGAIVHSRHGLEIWKSSKDSFGIGNLGIDDSYQSMDKDPTDPPTMEPISSELRLLLPNGGFATPKEAYESFGSLMDRYRPLPTIFRLASGSTSENLSQADSNTSPAMIHRAERAAHMELDLWAKSLLSSKDILGLQESGYKFQSLKINWVAIKIWLSSSLYNTAAETSHAQSFQELIRHYQNIWG